MCPNQLLQKSNLEVLQRKNQSTILQRAHRDDRNGYYICQILCPESEDISRREGFGKMGITPSFGLLLIRINTFWKRHDDAHTPTEDGPEDPQWETDRSPYRADRSGPAAKRAPLLVCSRRFLHRPIKPHFGCRSRSVGSYGGEAPPQDYINRPHTPWFNHLLISYLQSKS
jgi:hypothetical protein